MNQITQNIWLGDFFGANDRDRLHRNKITHILSVCDFKPPHSNEFKYLQIRLDDVISSNLLKYFPTIYEFIDNAVEEGGIVFVHCMAGISRSATSVICYLMKKYSWSLSKTTQFVKSRRSVICPNFGFSRQLQEWEKQLKKENPEFGTQDHLEKQQTKGPPQPTSNFFCKICRQKLFSNNDIIAHVSTVKPFDKAGTTAKQDAECTSYFTQAQDWILYLDQTSKGNILCPRKTCGSKLGYFCWHGIQCSCGKFVVPAFQFHKSKQVLAQIELTASKQHTENTRFTAVSALPSYSVGAKRHPPLPQGMHALSAVGTRIFN